MKNIVINVKKLEPLSRFIIRMTFTVCVSLLASAAVLLSVSEPFGVDTYRIYSVARYNITSAALILTEGFCCSLLIDIYAKRSA